jgi:NAD(P)-dependent dehydrogenase (short-subunit alcohol dehydrogenase family)
MDIANVIAFMVSDEASFVTGQSLPVEKLYLIDLMRRE